MSLGKKKVIKGLLAAEQVLITLLEKEGEGVIQRRTKKAPLSKVTNSQERVITQKEKVTNRHHPHRIRQKQNQ